MFHPTYDHVYQCSEMVSVLYEDRFQRTHELTANLEEISAGAATLNVDERLPLGTSICFRAKDHDLFGMVESCMADPILGWFVKIKLAPLSRWSGKMFVPQHFLALCATVTCPETERHTTVEHSGVSPKDQLRLLRKRFR